MGHPLFKELTEEEIALHDAKNDDYARGGDSLGNFKRVAAIMKLYPKMDWATPVGVSIVYKLKQFDAGTWMLSEGYEGEVEDVDTRYRDDHIYTKLSRILHREKK